MGLSDVEIEARLALLRRQREALDREIADLVLYLELGRRLGAAGTGLAPGDAGTGPEAASGPTIDPPPARDAAPPVVPVGRIPAVPARGQSGSSSEPHSDADSQSQSDAGGTDAARPPAIPFAEDAAGARRYGRALVEAAGRAIADAGRPLHAAEILAALVDQGFTVPGRDPVAALNTRLWKRSGPGGPLRRVGEATYALAAPA